MNKVLLASITGHSPTSRALDDYLHIGLAALEDVLDAVHGVKPEDQAPPPQPLKPRVCPRCQYENPTEARYCAMCNLVLDPVQAVKDLDADEFIDRLHAFLLRHPKKLKALIEGEAEEEDKPAMGE